jgi:hypothetical protein
MKTTDRDPRAEAPFAAEDEAPDALDRLLAEIRVPVAAGFSRQVMSRLPADLPRRERKAHREWAVAGALAAALIVIAAVLVAGTESSQGGIAGSIVDLAVATLAAGAGFLAASWRGLGQTVAAALDGSATALVTLGLLTLAANGLLFLLLRRRRAASAARSRHRS